MANILEIIVKAIRAGTGFKDSSAEAEGLKKQVGEVDKALQKLGLAIGAHELIEFGKASVLAARAQIDAIAALETAAEGVDDYTEALRLAKEATNGMASQQSLASSMSVLFGAGLAKSSQEAADLASAGTILSGVFESAGASQEMFVRLLSSGSNVLFNNFGITSQMVNAKKAEIEATTSLTGEEARMAAIKQVLIDMSIKYKGALSEETIGAKQFEAATADAQAALGALLLPQVTESMQNLGTAVRFATEGMEEMNPAVSGAVQGLIDIANPLTIFNTLIQSYEDLTGEATEATEDATAAIEDLSTASNRAALASYASMRGMVSQAGAARELENAFRQSAAAAASAQAASSFGGQQDTFTQNLNLTQLQQASDARLAAQAEKKAQEEEAARESEQLFRQSTQSMVKATNELGDQIASAVSGAVSQSSTDIAALLGITPEGEARVNEGVRRMAAVATGGLANEWTQGLATQLKGVDAAQAFVNAVGAGNESAVKEEAQKLAINPVVELFDAMAMANGIEQKLRGQDLAGQLNARIQKILSERGLDTSIEAISQVAQGTQQVADTATTSVGAIGGGATAAGEQVKLAFAEAIPAIDTLSARMSILIGLIERVGVVAQTSAGAVAGLNPPAVGTGNGLIPNGAQRKMNGYNPQ